MRDAANRSFEVQRHGLQLLNENPTTVSGGKHSLSHHSARLLSVRFDKSSDCNSAEHYNGSCR